MFRFSQLSQTENEWSNEYVGNKYRIFLHIFTPCLAGDGGMRKEAQKD